MMSLSGYVDDLQKKARYTFSRQDVATLKIQPGTLTKALQRLARTGRICQVRRGFYVIVPLEYSSTGVLPPDWFIDDLMRHMDSSYYVGLLTAASLHGAAHEQPQEFQVVVPSRELSIAKKNLRIRFFRYARAAKVPVARIKSYTGNIPVSTPASTALDLCRFAGQVGGLSVALSVISELAPKMTPSELIVSAGAEAELTQVQRLGWLLDRGGYSRLADRLAEWLLERHPGKVLLDSAKGSKGYKKDRRWQIIVNARPEVEA
jgi:predicted transcriptional regulator of viral defense system